MPHAVGQKLPNGFGLYDMSGNVSEWCWDWWKEYGEAPQIDPVGPVEGTERIKRGGSANDSPRGIAVFCRRSAEPERGSFLTGLRLMRRA